MQQGVPERIGRYVIECVLGRGAMGVVYRARDPRIDRVVALKTLVLPPGVDEATAHQLKARFLNEARAAGKLSHPAVVTVHDADEDPETGTAYLAMEFIEGRELKDLIAEGLPPQELLAILGQVADALQHAHERGIVHRDVKPANILVTESGQAKLADFGIARLGASTLTQDGQFLGSPAYMAPEQVQAGEIGPETDVYALAVILFEGLTGEKPFQGPDLISTTHAIVANPPPKASAKRPNLSPGIDSVLSRGLAKTRAGRPRSPRELVDEAEQTFAGSPLDETLVLPPRASRPGGGVVAEVREWVLGHRRAAGLIAAAVVAAIVLVGWLAWNAGGPGGASAQPVATTADAGWEWAEDATKPSPAPAVPGEGTVAPPSPTEPAVEEDDWSWADQPPADEAALEPEPAPPEAEPRPAPDRAPAPELSPTPEPAPAAPVVAAPRLAIDLYTIQGGVLTVTVGETVVHQGDIEKARRRPLKLRNPKRHFQVAMDVPPGRQVVTFTYDPSGKEPPLTKRSVRDFEAGATVKVTLDVGMLGRDLDVRYK